MKPKILVITGDGINCERETARAFDLVGGKADIWHINDLLESPAKLQEYQAMAFPGGFSFGDDLGSGQVLAIKLSTVLAEEFRKFVDAKKPIIGICNGFQALTKLGLLPNPFQVRSMALARNAQSHFINKWVELEVEKNTVCIWTKKITSPFALPIRHGEGKVVFTKGEEESIHRTLAGNGQIVLRYVDEVNGSYARIAGVCDPTGLIFGLMPHPEAAVSLLQHPQSTRLPERTQEGIGLQFFRNCISYLQESR